MCHGGCLGGARSPGRSSKAIVVSALDPVSLAHDGVPRFPELSMGRVAAGNGVAGHHLRTGGTKAGERIASTNLDHGVLAAALATVPAHVCFRLRETAQRRSDMAQPDSAELPLPDPAVADLDRVVCASTSPVVAQRISGS